MTETPQAPDGGPAPELSDEELDFLHRVFDLARDGATAELAAHLDAGIPVNLTNSDGDTLLILAAYREHIDTVRLLLDRGADTARVNGRGQTALAAAVFRNAGAIVTALLEAGADPDLGARTALQIAEHFELAEMTSLIKGFSSPSAG
jgi:ankyrin repeat protein